MAALLPPDIKRLGVILPSWVGDTVMATPMLRAMLQEMRARGGEVIALGRGGLDEILAGAGVTDRVLVQSIKGLGGPRRAGRMLRANGVQAVVLLPNSMRSAVAARFSGAIVRIGYRRDGRGFLLSHPVEVPAAIREGRPMPAIDYYAVLGEGTLGRPITDRSMRLGVTNEQRLAMSQSLEGVPRPYVALCAGASKAEKRWPSARFAAVADALVKSKTVAGAVLIGSPAEKAILDDVQLHARSLGTDVVNLCGRLTLGGVKAVLAECAILVTNDTGPRHMALALGRPVVCVMGPTDPRWTTTGSPLDCVLTAEPFLPDDLMADHHPKACRIDRIPASDVFHAADCMVQPQQGSSGRAAPVAAANQA